LLEREDRLPMKTEGPQPPNSPRARAGHPLVKIGEKKKAKKDKECLADSFRIQPAVLIKLTWKWYLSDLGAGGDAVARVVLSLLKGGGGRKNL